MQRIADWLGKLGLGQYAQRFAENDINFTILSDLSDQDLKELGVSSLGHRRQLLRAIAELNIQTNPPKLATAAPASVAPQPHDTAERRQVTVMFSDLVGSTALSAHMDPEDLREVISAYQKCVANTVRRFDGFVAKYMGDGVLIYFGYPQAHEDDAERAVRAGLELLAATKVGWTIGAGVEHAITPAWSVKLEYDYVGLGGENVATPRGLVQPIPGVNLYNFTPAGTTSVTQNFQEATLGLNYKFGMDPSAQWGPASSAFPVRAPVMASAFGWELEAGARFWGSSGKFQKDVGATTNPALANILISRLTYDTTAGSGELFGRIETPQNVFLKGNIGVGSLLGGKLNDEDWAVFAGTVPYSNTSSTVDGGEIDYGTLDLGYDFFRGPGYKLGAFVGYNFYKENKSAYGCTQIANQLSDCVPAIPSSVLVLTENDTWQSLRIGANGEIMITDRFKLGADVAYLPYVAFNGTDDHVLRALIIQESGTGRGVQLEGILSYMITDQFSFGVGGRYWAMWTTKDAIADDNSAPCPCQTQPAKAERSGVFVQLSYKGLGSPSERFW